MHKWERSTGLHTILTNCRFSGSPNVQNPQLATSLLEEINPARTSDRKERRKENEWGQTWPPNASPKWPLKSSGRRMQPFEKSKNPKQNKQNKFRKKNKQLLPYFSLWFSGKQAKQTKTKPGMLTKPNSSGQQWHTKPPWIKAEAEDQEAEGSHTVVLPLSRSLVFVCRRCGFLKKKQRGGMVVGCFWGVKKLMFKNSRLFNRSELADAYANKQTKSNECFWTCLLEKGLKKGKMHLKATLWHDFKACLFSSAVRLGCPLAYNHNLVMHQMPLWVSPKAFLDMEIQSHPLNPPEVTGLGLDPTD